VQENIDIAINEKGNGGKTVKRSLDDISASAKNVDRDITKMNKTALAAGAAMGAALGGLAVMLFRGFSNAAKAMADTYDNAKKLGTTTQILSRLEFAGRAYGMSIDQVHGSWQSLQAIQERAAKGLQGTGKLFKQLGIDVTEADGQLRDTNLVLRDLADRFEKMPDSAGKARLAAKLFGNENRQMVQVLSEGTKGLDALAKKSDEFGYTVGTEVAQQLDAFYDQLDLVKLQIEGMYRQALPGLLPMLKDFSNLLNSPEFKNGFNALVQGAAQAIVWRVKLASTVGNVTKFIGEEIAARVGGAAATDVVRVQERIERLQDTLKGLDKVKANPITGMFTKEAMNISELKPSDLLKPFEDVRARVQAELDQEKNKLQIGIQMNEESALKAAEDARKAAEEALKGGGGPVPTIDWTALGRDPKGKKDNSAKEMEQLQRELNGVLSAINPVLNATLDLARAEDTLNKAASAGLITQKEAGAYLEEYEALLKDQLDPLGAITRELDEQIHVAGLLNDERQIEAQMLGIVEQLRLSGIKVTETETAALREQLKTLQAIDKMAAAKEDMLGQSRGKRDEQFSIDSKALSDLVGSGDVEGADKFNIINSMLGGTMDDTQAAFDAQMEQFAEYYARVQELRDLDVLNAKEASDAIAAIKRAELDTTLARTEQALGTAAGLMQSNSKEAFRVGQAAAIGQAIVNTYTGATAAFQSAAAIPYVGWIMAPIAAAGAIAAGMAQVSAIRSQQMPAYRTGGSYTVGGSGGVDSQTVAMRATPGEQININTPAQSRAMERMAAMAEQGGERGNFTQNVTIVQQGKPDRRTPSHQARALRKQTQAEFERNR
jgi:hypothetical protein